MTVMKLLQKECSEIARTLYTRAGAPAAVSPDISDGNIATKMSDLHGWPFVGYFFLRRGQKLRSSSK